MDPNRELAPPSPNGPFEEGPEDPGHYLPQEHWNDVKARVQELKENEGNK